MTGRLLTEKHGHLGYLIFDHEAHRNAVTKRMWQEIPGAVQRFAEDDDVRVVIMRGAGDVAFVAGADISEFESARSGPEAEAYDTANAAAFDALAGLEKPLVAIIHGFCVGGGLAIALHADLRFAAEDGVFSIPAARLGLGYSMAGLQTLIDVVGVAHAKEIFFTANRFSAEDALGLGLVHRVYPKDELEPAAQRIAEGVARNAPLTLRAAKVAMRELSRTAADRDMDRVAASISRCYGSADYREGVTAFLEKRAPRFGGR